MTSDQVVVHLDVDCFYAQAEMLRRPWLRDRPLGVTQKFLVVTSNYIARNLGVPKMASIEEAKRRCPDIMLINGEDLTPYRASSKSIMKVLRRFGTLERRGLDECAVDVTEEVHRRAEDARDVEGFTGIVLGQDKALNSHKVHIFMLGSRVAAEMRRAVEQETGFQCSCGIAQNKMLAKMACFNKPNKQTCMLPSAVMDFLVPLPVRKIPGVGSQMQEVLNDMGATTIGELQKLTYQELFSRLGDRVAKMILDASRGHDPTPVHEKGDQKSLSVEDSFRPCTSPLQAKEVLHFLAPHLISRLDEDREDTGRTPKTLTVKWRSQGNWSFSSVSTRMPDEVLSSSLGLQRRRDVLVETALKLFIQSLQGRAFCVLNIGATNFVTTAQAPSASADIRLFFKGSHSSSKSSETKIGKAGFERDQLSSKLQEAAVGILLEDQFSASTHSTQETPVHEQKMETCVKCGKRSDNQQEHMDYHLALEIHLQEKEHARKALQPTKRLRRNATLDSFIRKL